MARVRIERLGEALRNEGFTADQVKGITQVARDISEKTYNLAVVFLGVVTLLLAAGSLAALFTNTKMPEALWTLVGAGIGGLAGVFTAK